VKRQTRDDECCADDDYDEENYDELDNNVSGLCIRLNKSPRVIGFWGEFLRKDVIKNASFEVKFVTSRQFQSIIIQNTRSTDKQPNFSTKFFKLTNKLSTLFNFLKLVKNI